MTKFPEQGTYHWLNSIAAGRHGTAFAVGINTGTSVGPISIRWTGHAWVKAPAPRAAGLYAVAFAPGGTAWAAGSYTSGGHNHAQAYRWTGRTWSRVASPGTNAQLNGLGFASPSYGWAVGQANYTRTYILHWNGRSWN